MQGRNPNQDLINCINSILYDIECEQFSANNPSLIQLRSIVQASALEGLNELEERVDSLHRKVESLHFLNNHLRILADFAQTCAQTVNEETLLRKAHELVSQVMPTDAFYIALYDEEKQMINFPYLVDEGIEYPDSPLEFCEENITSRVIKTRQTLHVKTQKEIGPDYDVFGENDTNTCIFVPLLMDDQVKGVISAQCHKEFAYRKEHEELLLIIGNQVLSSIQTARLYKKIFEMSLEDEMTGLGNFRAFHNDFSSAIKEENSLVLVMLDSDNLKGINDYFGHEVGDSYLIRLAEGMKSLCNDKINAYRYAGDEFMFIIKSSSNEQVGTLINSLDDYLREHTLESEEDSIKVYFSSGASKFPQDGTTVEDLKRKADQALYRSKGLGYSSKLVFYSEIVESIY